MQGVGSDQLSETFETLSFQNSTLRRYVVSSPLPNPNFDCLDESVFTSHSDVQPDFSSQLNDKSWPLIDVGKSACRPQLVHGDPAQPGAAALGDGHVDGVLFAFAGLSTIWLAYLVFRASIQPGWPMLLLIVFWVLLTYLLLPRLHRILTRLYVPGYFIGRARTSDGLLGDPVNLALRGQEAQVHAAMTRAGGPGLTISA